MRFILASLEQTCYYCDRRTN